jgi:hypothetical protein
MVQVVPETVAEKSNIIAEEPSEEEILDLVKLVLQKRNERQKATAGGNVGPVDVEKLAERINHAIDSAVEVDDRKTCVPAVSDHQEMVVDIKWKAWSPREVANFLTKLGGFCALYAAAFEAMGVAGADLPDITDSGLEGIGVTNGWHRVKVLDAIQVMIVCAEKKRKTQEAVTRKNKKKTCLDCNSDGMVDFSDVVGSVYGIYTGFLGFAFNKDVQGLVVGIMIGGGLRNLANSVVTDLITPLLISPW